MLIERNVIPLPLGMGSRQGTSAPSNSIQNPNKKESATPEDGAHVGVSVFGTEPLCHNVLPGDVPQETTISNQDAANLDGLNLVGGVFQGGPELQLGTRDVVCDVTITNRILWYTNWLPAHIKRTSSDESAIRDQMVSGQDIKGGAKTDVDIPIRSSVLAPAAGRAIPPNRTIQRPDGALVLTPEVHVLPVCQLIGFANNVHQGVPFLVGRKASRDGSSAQFRHQGLLQHGEDNILRSAGMPVVLIDFVCTGNAVGDMDGVAPLVSRQPSPSIAKGNVDSCGTFLFSRKAEAAG